MGWLNQLALLFTPLVTTVGGRKAVGTTIVGLGLLILFNELNAVFHYPFFTTLMTAVSGALIGGGIGWLWGGMLARSHNSPTKTILTVGSALIALLSAITSIALAIDRTNSTQRAFIYELFIVPLIDPASRGGLQYGVLAGIVMTAVSFFYH